MTEELKEALLVILKQPKEGLMVYARIYAQACFDLGDARESKVTISEGMVNVARKETGMEMVGEELRVQLLYVLSNLDEWEGKKAQQIKKIIKKYTKGR